MSVKVEQEVPTEVVAQTYSVKNLFLKILQNSQENNCAELQVCNFIKK